MQDKKNRQQLKKEEEGEVKYQFHRQIDIYNLSDKEGLTKKKQREGIIRQIYIYLLLFRKAVYKEKRNIIVVISFIKVNHIDIFYTNSSSQYYKEKNNNNISVYEFFNSI